MSEKVVQIVLNSFVQDSRVMRVCKSLSIEGYKVTVLALHDEGLEEQEELDGYHIHRIKVVSKSLSKQPIIHILKYVEFLFKAIFEINKIRPHIIHGHDPNGLFIAWLAKNCGKADSSMTAMNIGLVQCIKQEGINPYLNLVWKLKNTVLKKQIRSLR